jgi:hypothetical protein
VSSFGKCELLRSVTFAPGSKLKRIDANAFHDCTNLVTPVRVSDHFVSGSA